MINFASFCIDDKRGVFSRRGIAGKDQCSQQKTGNEQYRSAAFCHAAVPINFWR
jgi:hypothetical protein